MRVFQEFFKQNLVKCCRKVKMIPYAVPSKEVEVFAKAMSTMPPMESRTDAVGRNKYHKMSFFFYEKVVNFTVTILETSLEIINLIIFISKFKAYL